MKHKLKISFNSPVVLGFTFISLAVLLLNYITKGWSNYLLFGVYRAPLTDPLTYLRFFGHVLGHASLEHYLGNITLLLVVGPMLEEKYGSRNMIYVILVTAVITGLVHFIFFPHEMLLGASGVVFAFILLASFTRFEEGTIPLTFILVALFYIGTELYNSFAYQDNISNLTHILGGFIGAAIGYRMNKKD